MVAQKHQSLLIAFLMALLMSGIMSLVLSCPGQLATTTEN